MTAQIIKIPYAGRDKTEANLRISGSMLRETANAGLMDIIISALWVDKFDTLDIARKLEVPESVIANRPAAIRDARA